MTYNKLILWKDTAGNLWHALTGGGVFFDKLNGNAEAEDLLAWAKRNGLAVVDARTGRRTR